MKIGTVGFIFSQRYSSRRTKKSQSDQNIIIVATALSSQNPQGGAHLTPRSAIADKCSPALSRCRHRTIFQQLARTQSRQAPHTQTADTLTPDTQSPDTKTNTNTTDAEIGLQSYRPQTRRLQTPRHPELCVNPRIPGTTDQRPREPRSPAYKSSPFTLLLSPRVQHVAAGFSPQTTNVPYS